jgi:hypothetical protein
MHESSALRTSSRSSKWGVIAAVRRDLYCQRVPFLEVVAIDIVVPTVARHGFILRALGWDPGGPQPTPSQFWGQITELCLAAPSHVWRIIGDCNLTLASVETFSSAPPSPNRLPYLEHLHTAAG